MKTIENSYSSAQQENSSSIYSVVLWCFISFLSRTFLYSLKVNVCLQYLTIPIPTDSVFDDFSCQVYSNSNFTFQILYINNNIINHKQLPTFGMIMNMIYKLYKLLNDLFGFPRLFNRHITDSFWYRNPPLSLLWGHLGARLRESEDVVNKEQHILKDWWM